MQNFGRKILTIQHALVKFVRLFHRQSFTLYGSGKFGEFSLFKIWQKTFGELIVQPKRLLIVNTNLDGFSLTDHKQFTKFPNFPTIPYAWLS